MTPLGVGVDAVEGVVEGLAPVVAVDGRSLARQRDEVGGVVKEVDVDEVEGRVVDPPARAQCALAGPARAGEVAERKLVLLDERVRRRVVVKVGEVGVRFGQRDKLLLLQLGTRDRG